MKLFTWKDVERSLYLNKDRWLEKITSIEVYPNAVQIYAAECSNRSIYTMLEDILQREIDKDEIILDLGEERMTVSVEQSEEILNKKNAGRIVPLFRNILYQTKSAYEPDMLSAGFEGVPVIAFHSYKGGVGRTLSLISFVKAWTENKNKDKTLLVIDADIEAPGLSWICDGINREQSLSYLDLLVLAQQSRDAGELAESVKEKIKLSTFSYENDNRMFSQYFMPTYRYEEQLLDIYASPQSIVQGYNKRFFMGEVLSAVGKILGVDAVIVDLRAGISDFSAPLLFDPRIKKYIVSSTSYQSCIGTNLLLRQLLKGLIINEDTLIPEVLITMVQNNEDTEGIHDIIRKPYELNISDNNQDFLDHVIYDLDYASELIRLENMQQIMFTLDSAGRKFHDKIRNIVMKNYESPSKKIQKENPHLDRVEIIHRIHDLAEEQLTAEGNDSFPIMRTKAINQLVSRFATEKPVAVIIGAKGSGKTYLYREILKRQNWERFVFDMGGELQEEKTVIVPLLATENIANMSGVLTKSINNYKNTLEIEKMDIAFYQKNRDKTREMLSSYNSNSEWSVFWKKLMLPEGMTSLEQLNELCRQKRKKILFLVDGLEELFNNTLSDKNEQVAMESLCKNVISELQVKYENISCLVFIRKDIVQNVMNTNFEQFTGQYKGLELQWSRAEALRMALWLVVQAVEEFNYNQIKIEEASENVIRQELERLWGVKLGKANSNEAYSSNWILAALSDFNGQLQARDIIRFLEYATDDEGNVKYEDRYIMPSEIRKAIPKCSKKKIEEIEQEIKVLKPIFEKFKDAGNEKKKLPFSADTFGLTKDDEKIMIREGYLYNDSGKYYLPEIIRYALDFTYGKGARPRVLALMGRKNNI